MTKRINFVKRLVKLGQSSVGIVAPMCELKKGNIELGKEYEVTLTER